MKNDLASQRGTLAQNGKRVKKRSSSLPLGLGLWSAALMSSAHAAGFNGSLLDAVRITLENAPSIAAGKLEVAASRGQLLLAKSEFEPALSTGINYQSTHTPLLAAYQTPGVAELSGSALNYTLGATQKFRSGLAVNPALTVTRTQDNASNSSAPSASNLALNFVLPLLKGSAASVNTAAETAAQFGLDSSAHAYRHALAASIAGTVAAYWDFLAAAKNLGIGITAQARAKTLLDDARKLAKGDEIPAADVMKYEANLASETIGRISAEQAVTQARAAMALAMGLYSAEIGSLLLPAEDFPALNPAALASLEQSSAAGVMMTRAADDRYDVRAAKSRLHAAQTLLDAARQDNKSKLDLSFSIGYNGLVEGKSAASALTAMQYGARGVNAAVGINYTLPVSNHAQQGLILQRMAAAEQSRIETETLLNNVRANIQVQINNLRAAAMQLEQTQFRLRTQATVLDNDKKKYRLGMATVLDLLTSENQLTASQVGEINARRNFAQALIRFRFETGALLDPDADVQSIDSARLTTIPAL
jgi:outer membrane protein